MGALFYWMEENGHRGLKLSVWDQSPAVGHLFGLHGSRPIEILAQRLGVRSDQVAAVRQEHGDSILVIDPSPDEPRAGQGWIAQIATQAYDALITNQVGLVITVQTADCLPILIWDENRKAIAAVHAGWRGSLKEIAPKTVFMMQSCFGTRPQDLRVGIGPAIGPCCYEVDGPVLNPLRKRFGFWKEIVREKDTDRGMLDLPGLNVRQLIESGVPADRISVADTCTACHPGGFCSYRRDGRSAGSMVSGIMIRHA